jgi:hypothetical protein
MECVSSVSPDKDLPTNIVVAELPVFVVHLEQGAAGETGESDSISHLPSHPYVT